MKTKVFVDGLEGTTGLKINERLQARTDLIVLNIDPSKRKDTSARKDIINESDIVFLCLPDQAAKEAVSIAGNCRARIIDASTAHRTSPGWVYGLPELNKSQRDKIKMSRFVSVPGCHATGFILAVNPLLESGVMERDYPVSCFSLTGYTGGGKKLIEQYESKRAGDKAMSGCRPYALSLNHKHLPEMATVAGLQNPPLFNPLVGPFPQGMIVTVPIVLKTLKNKLRAFDIYEIMSGYYVNERFVQVMPFSDDALLDDGFLDPQACNGTNRAEIFVFGHEEQACIMCRFDNLGKGASGAAIQCMNIMKGCDEGLGL